MGMPARRAQQAGIIKNKTRSGGSFVEVEVITVRACELGLNPQTLSGTRC